MNADDGPVGPGVEIKSAGLMSSKRDVCALVRVTDTTATANPIRTSPTDAAVGMAASVIGVSPLRVAPAGRDFVNVEGMCH